MAKFLDLSGVSHLYGKIKTLVETKTGEAVKSIDWGGSVADGKYEIRYTTINNSTKTIELNLGVASESMSGVVTANQVKAWNAKVDAEDVEFGLANNKIDLKINGNVIGSVDTSDFVIDGMLQNAELITVAAGEVTDECPTAGKYLMLTFNTDANSKVVYANVTDLIDVYSLVANKTKVEGDYIELSTTVTGKGTAAEPWVVGVTLRETGLTNKFNTIDDSISQLQSDLEEITEVGGEPNKVDDVTVNGTSIVTNKIAKLVDVTTSASGLMSAADKVKLDGIEGALTTAEIDAALA